MVYNLLKDTKIYKSFVTLARKGNLPHAVLLYSKDTYAAKNMLKLFACAVLCRSGKPCLECNDCRRVLGGTHPDCKTYPAKDKILVGDIDNLIEDASFKPCEGSSKVYLINAGDTMSTDSQNKLLKTLEEPPEAVYIFICAANPENMLPTVKSRCAEMDLQPFTPQQIAQFLSEAGGKGAFAAAMSCGGLLGRALEMSESGGYQSFYNFIYSLFKTLQTKDDILICMEKINSFEDKNAALDIMQLYFRDCLMYKCGQNDLIFDKNSDGIKSAEYFCQKDIIKFLESAANAKRKLTLNCNAAPLFENIFIDILSARENNTGGAVFG
jgi:DNA polymerase-3 subunit delta'